MLAINFKSSSTIQTQKKDNSKPMALGSIGIGLATGYAIPNLGKERSLIKFLTESEKNIAKTICEREKKECYYDNLLSLYNSAKYDHITSTKNITEKYENNTLKLEDFVDEEDIRVVREKCTEIETKSKEKSKKFIDSLKKVKKQYLLTGLTAGAILAGVNLLERQTNKNKEENNKKNSTFLMAPLTAIGAFGGLLANIKSPEIQMIKDLTEETNLIKEIKFLEKEDEIIKNYFSKKTLVYEEKLEKAKDNAEKIEQIKNLMDDDIKKLEAYYNRKISKEECFGSDLQKIEKEISIAKEKIRKEDLEKATNIYKDFCKKNKKFIAIGASIGLALGSALCLIKNSKTNKNSKG